jgi:phage protein D
MFKPLFKLEYADCEQRLKGGSGELSPVTPFNASNQAEKKDITKDVCEFVTRIEYTDYEHGQSDEIQITFEDSQKLWQGAWIPVKGDRLRLYLGYETEKLFSGNCDNNHEAQQQPYGLLNCGIFEIDELEFETPPDTITLKALAVSIKKPLRQKNSKGYENRTLRQIAQEIADKHGYTLVGTVADVRVDRITQNSRRDLEFLRKLAEQYGYIFKISENNLVFYDVQDLHGAKPTQIFYRTDLTRINLREKTSQRYKSVQVTYFDPKTKKTMKASAKNENVVKGDTLKINARCANKKAAIAKAKAALGSPNTGIEGSVDMPGNPFLVAGINIELKDLGHFSGKYHLDSVRHVLDRTTGYTTNAEVKSC